MKIRNNNSLRSMKKVGKNKSVLLNQLDGNYFEVEDYNNFFFGAWDNKNEVNSLEICGLSPKEVIPFKTSDGDIGYMWYIIDEEGIISNKLGEVNYGDFTYNDIKEKLSLKCTME